MLIKATLSNARHPEYGEVTIPFPIKTNEYDRTMEMLANLEIGDVMGRDCKIMELSSPYSILQKLEGSEVNIDELDYRVARSRTPCAMPMATAEMARRPSSTQDMNSGKPRLSSPSRFSLGMRQSMKDSSPL